MGWVFWGFGKFCCKWQYCVLEYNSGNRTITTSLMISISYCWISCWNSEQFHGWLKLYWWEIFYDLILQVKEICSSFYSKNHPLWSWINIDAIYAIAQPGTWCSLIQYKADQIRSILNCGKVGSLEWWIMSQY